MAKEHTHYLSHHVDHWRHKRAQRLQNTMNSNIVQGQGSAEKRGCLRGNGARDVCMLDSFLNLDYRIASIQHRFEGRNGFKRISQWEFHCDYRICYQKRHLYKAASDNDDMEEELRKAMEECNDEDSDVNLDDDLCGLGTNSDDDAELSKSPQSTNGDVESDESDSYGVDILLDFKNGVKQCNA